MGPLLRLIGLRELWRRPGRTALAVGGIALGVALVLSIQLINRATLVALRETVEGTAGRAELQVVAASDAGLPEELIDPVRAAPMVALAVPLVEGSAFVADGLGESLTIFGVDLGDEASVRTYRGVTQDAQQVIDDPLVFLAQPDSIVVTRAFAAARHLALGDRFPVVAASGRRTLTVRGLLEPAGVARVYGSSLAIMDVLAAQRLLGKEGRVDHVDVVLRDGMDVERSAAALRAALPPGLAVERPERRGQQVEAMLAAFQAMLSSTSGIALMVAVFIIYNSLATVVVERRREIGILRAVGVRRREVVALHLGEALCAGTIGILAGCVLGRGLAHLMVGPVSGSAAAALSLPLHPGKPDLGPGPLLIAAAAGMAATLVAAILPALDAARMPIIEAIRRAAPTASPTSRGGRVLAAGVGLAALGVACLAGAVRTQAVALAYPAAMLLLGATALLSFPAVLLTAPALRPIGTRLFGASGRLAGDLGRRMPTRTAATVAALTLGLALSAGFSILACSFERSVEKWVHSWTARDLFVRSADRERGLIPPPLSARLVDALRTVPGIRDLDTFRMMRQRYGDETIALTTSSSVPLTGKRVRISENFEHRFGKHPGDTVRLVTPRGRRRFRIVAVERNYNSDRGTVILGDATFRRLWGDRLVTDIGVLLAPGADPAAVRSDILARYGPEYRLAVLQPKQIEARLLADIAQAFAFTWALQVVTMLVAVLGVFDTVLAGVLARRREIGVLRAVGCLRRQVAVAFGLEGLLMGALGTGLGLVAGLGLSGIWIAVVFPDAIGFIVDLYVPLARLAGLAVVTVALAVAAAAVPARRAARLAVAEALNAE